MRSLMRPPGSLSSMDLKRSGEHAYLSCQWRWSQRCLERRRLGQDFRPRGEGTGVERQCNAQLSAARECPYFNTQHELAFLRLRFRGSCFTASRSQLGRLTTDEGAWEGA